ncbi:MAG: hypothetical protein H0V81_06560 [Solirubrobacterales bacterium]|nr:hypothetical protein [Solirubrobacterales bacterium]
MPLTHRIPLPVHTALRLATGLFTMLLPFLAGFDPPAMVVSVTIGMLVVGVALSAAGAEQADRSTVSGPNLESLDYGLVLALTAAAVVLAAVGASLAAVLLTAVALVQLAGNLLTDYRTA